MPKSENQKQKLLYIIKILQEYTDEDHVISTKDLIEKLRANDISAERKSIYADIQCLQDFGFDIMQKKGKTESGYYLASREFELAELKLLVDAVQSSRFVTEKKSRELIQKLEKQASTYQARQLHRQVKVLGRVKTENEKIYYSVVTIYTAIDADRQISFSYLEWTTTKTLKPRRNGKTYVVSPLALIWDDENYYLAAYDAEADCIKHYRVDKMKNTKVEEKKREGQDFFNMDPAEYSKSTFGMFGGDEEQITLLLPKKLIGVIMDRFGRETDVRVVENDKIRVHIRAAVSGQFFGWLTGLGEGVQIASPTEVRERYKQWLKNMLAAQDGAEE